MQILVLREVRWNEDGDLTSEGVLVTYLGVMSTRKESCSCLKEPLLIVSPAWKEMETELWLSDRRQNQRYRPGQQMYQKL